MLTWAWYLADKRSSFITVSCHKILVIAEISTWFRWHTGAPLSVGRRVTVQPEVALAVGIKTNPERPRALERQAVHDP